MAKVRNYTPDEIKKILSYKDIVKTASARNVRFYLEFRLKIYDTCYPNFTNGSVRDALYRNGFDASLLNYCTINSIAKNFIVNGRPKGATNRVCGKYNYNLTIDKSYDEYLLNTGYFIKSKKGIKITNSFFEELVKISLDTKIEDYLVDLGIDIKRFGYQRLHLLKNKIDWLLNYEIVKLERKCLYLDEDIVSAKKNPYIKTITNKKLTLKDEFYNEALVFRDRLKLTEIFKLFKISLNISLSTYNNILYKLSNWIDTGARISDDSDIFIDIQINKSNVLTKIVNTSSALIKSNVRYLTKCERKNLCVGIQKINIPSILGNRLELVKSFGISKSNYYSILKNENYGMSELNKNNSDNDDFVHIKKVIDYKGYPKGSRMIYMMLPRIAGVHMNRKKIIRLCKKFGYSSGVRKPNLSRSEMKKRIELYCKDNLVKRGFRLYKPGKIILTDVSYLPYLDNRAYLSATKDACSGKITLEVSKNNDSNLIQSTIDKVEPTSDAIFHSDQGILYMNDSYQSQLIKKGYKISMSKRGNCWDNASQESFFGHMKDECRISECENFDELLKIIKDYEYYYNYERPQWTRNKMTPIEFEKYINEMDDETYDNYHKNEIIKYELMKENAKNLAITRAKNIGFMGL